MNIYGIPMTSSRTMETVLHISQLLYNKKTCQEEVAHKIKFYNEFVFVFCGCSSWVKHQEKISWFQPIVWCQWYPIHLSIMSIFSIQFYPVWLPWYELYFHFLDLKRSYQAYISFGCATNTTQNLNKLSSPVLRRILRTSNKIVGFFWVRSCSLVQIFMFPDTTSKTLPLHWLRNAQKMNKSILVTS